MWKDWAKTNETGKTNTEMGGLRWLTEIWKEPEMTIAKGRRKLRLLIKNVVKEN